MKNKSSTTAKTGKMEDVVMCMVANDNLLPLDTAAALTVVN